MNTGTLSRREALRRIAFTSTLPFAGGIIGGEIAARFAVEGARVSILDRLAEQRGSRTTFFVFALTKLLRPQEGLHALVYGFRS